MNNKGKKLAAFAIALSTLFSASISTNAAKTAQSSNSEKSTNSEEKNPHLNSKTAPSNKPAGKPAAKKAESKNSLLKFWPVPAAILSLWGAKQIYDSCFANRAQSGSNYKPLPQKEIVDIRLNAPAPETNLPVLPVNNWISGSQYKGLHLSSNCIPSDHQRSLKEVFPITGGKGENYFKLRNEDFPRGTFGTNHYNANNSWGFCTLTTCQEENIKKTFRYHSKVDNGSSGLTTYLVYDNNNNPFALRRCWYSSSQNIAFSNEVNRIFRMTREIDSVHSANIHYSGYDQDGYYCLVYDYVPGKKLSERISDLDFINKANVCEDIVKEVAFIIYQIAMGLADMHRKSIIHRDINPENIQYFSSSQKIKLVGFGIAKKYTGALSQTTIGTPLYMSPEILFQEPYDSKVDVWALGCILYRMLDGKMPFTANSIQAMIYNLQNESIDLRPAAPKLNWLCELTHRMLEKDPTKRPTALQVAETILAYHNNR